MFDKYEDEGREDDAHDRRVQRCRSCNARIIWLKTKSGKNMPTDADTVSVGDTEFDPDSAHISHFATCPRADSHRKRGK